MTQVADVREEQMEEISEEPVEVNAKMQAANRLLTIPLVASMGLLTLLTGWAAFGRRIPSIELYGGYELVQLSGVWLYFLGMGYATLADENIMAGDGFRRSRLRLPKWLRSFCGFVAPTVLLVVAIVLASNTWNTIQRDISLDRVSLQLGLPNYIWPLALLTGFLLVALSTVLIFVDKIIKRKKGGSQAKWHK